MKAKVMIMGVWVAASSMMMAKEGKHPSAEVVLKKLDQDGDSRVSFEEYKASKHYRKDAGKATEYFKKVDENQDGVLTLEEMQKAFGRKS